MKKNAVIAGLILICFVLQTTLFRAITFGGIGPNVLIVVTSSFGFMRGRKTGLLVGFFSGILCDIFFGEVLGFYAMIYMYIGFLNGLFHKIFFPEDIKLPIVLIAVSNVVYGMVVYLLLFLLRGQLNFSYYFIHIILPEIVYSLAVTVFIYPVLLVINRQFNRTEKRSAA